MKPENLFLYVTAALFIYEAVLKPQPGAVTVIPSDEPLRIIPEPDALKPTIPPLRTSDANVIVNGLGDAWPGVTAGRLYSPTPAFPMGHRLMYPLPHRRVKLRQRWTR